MPPVLTRPQWLARAAAHESRVDGWLADHLDRRRRGEKHPVFDFLFTYYSYRPAQLRRWHPGAGVVLEDADPSQFGADYRTVEGGATLDTETVLARRSASLIWIGDLLAKTAQRPAQLGCFGLHEWAMVYRTDRPRHATVPLRLGPTGTDAVVESLPVACTHHDAFRFFTAAARPLNRLQPTREDQVALEQPGCLHATMDLYKWAYKLLPATPAELLGDCFVLAAEVRELDMRASPYDLADLGYPPVRIETPAGRAEYARAQQRFAERSAPLRQRLLALCSGLLDRTPGALAPPR